MQLTTNNKQLTTEYGNGELTTDNIKRENKELMSSAN